MSEPIKSELPEMVIEKETGFFSGDSVVIKPWPNDFHALTVRIHRRYDGHIAIHYSFDHSIKEAERLRDALNKAIEIAREMEQATK